MKVYVCVGSACHKKGSYNVINELQRLIDEYGLGDEVTIKAALCLGNCANAVSAQVEGEEVLSLSPGTVRSFFEEEIRKRIHG